jgi:nicotinamidase-related amidase
MSKSGNSHAAPLALLLVDVINHFEFPDGERLLRHALPIAPKLVQLKKRARAAGIPVIYVNDNFGRWRSQASELVDYCLRPRSPGASFVEQIKPDKDDYFVLKPMHSAFYQTPLETLLRYLGISSLILCGLATNSCIVCTAHDANMRDIGLIVPADCSASRTPAEHKAAIRHIRLMIRAKVARSANLQLNRLTKQEAKAG